ncbi:interferon regulatory factor 7 isoform 2-T2 [Liasis olivaceus]
MFSKKYNEDISTPSKWKINFRCAMNSTKRFEELVSNEPDFHKYRIIPPKPKTESTANLPSGTNNGSDHEAEASHFSPYGEECPALHQPTHLPQLEIDTAFQTLTLESGMPGAVVPNENAAGNFYQTGDDALQWIIQQSQLNQTEMQQVSWAPAVTMDSSNPIEEAVYNTSCFVDNIYLNEEPQENGVMNNEARNDYPLIANQQTMMEQSIFEPSAALPTDEPAINNVPSQNPIEAAQFTIQVSIYYREKLQREAEVNSCMFTYNQQNCHKQHNAQIIQFPNPEVLTDQKQIQHTLIALQTANLLLYQKNGKICAERLGPCKVFCAFSKELDNRFQDPPCKLLPRNVETEIFNYEQFFQELIEFRDGRRSSSPDYTIYLCFGQQFSAFKPKESKLILVKLVPSICKYWHEVLQREGFSSLNSENVSLQISNSLFDMIEHFNTIFMQTETVY